jgi:hypothetical protein
LTSLIPLRVWSEQQISSLQVCGNRVARNWMNGSERSKSNAARDHHFCGAFDVFRIETCCWLIGRSLRFTFYCLRGRRCTKSRPMRQISMPKLLHEKDARWRRQRASKGTTIMRITGGLLLLIAVSLGGCIHATGPCYGVGCHAFTAPSGAGSQQSAAQKPDSLTAPEKTRSSTQAAAQTNASAAQKSHGMLALLKKIRL